MNELINVNTDTQTVSARELHKVLEIKYDFKRWVESNFKDFIENVDFFGGHMNVKGNQYGGEQEIVDYSVTTNMAQHLCLMSKTEKGKQCRQYLIDLEKAWNTPEQIMARALKVAQQTVDSLKERCKFLGGQVVEQQQVIEELQPKASYYDLILQCKDLIATTIIAKDYGMSAKKFNEMLHDMGVQYRQSDTWVLYAEYQGYGYLGTKTHNYADTVGVQHSKEHSYWTQKGRLFLYNLLKQKGILPIMEQGSKEEEEVTVCRDVQEC